MSTAAKVREHKSAHPEMYCSVRGCLWRTGGRNGSPCRKHAAPTAATITGGDLYIREAANLPAPKGRRARRIG